MNLGCLLTSKIIALTKWKGSLIPHENSSLLCERIEASRIIISWHLLLHVLLLSFLLTGISMRLLADSATRLASRVASIVVLSRWEHHLLIFFLFSIV